MKVPSGLLLPGYLQPGALSLKALELYKRICLLLLLIELALQANAQVNTYAFNAYSGTYVTVPSPANVHTGTWDDAVANVTIPFTFFFNGIGYTSCSVNTNGYVTFGATASNGTSYIPISATTGYSGAISALGFDLIHTSSAAITSGVSGTSPNRIFIVQWNNARRYASGAAISGDVFNFQIRLYETSNFAEVMYGTCTVTSGTDRNVQVGLRGTSNSDYKNVLVTSAIQWNGAQVGTANNNTCVTGTGTGELPGSGLMFRWSPPTCAGTPTAPTAAISPASGVAGAAFSATYSGGSTGLAFTNQWQYSYDNVTFTNWAGQTTSPLAGSAQSTLYLRVLRTCTTTGLTSTSNVVSYTVTSWNLSSNGSGYTCSGTFYDSGGSGSAYANNQDYTYTFYPAYGTTGQKVRLTFTAFATENLYDGMMIYNGNSTAAPLISSGLGAGTNATTCPAGSYRGSTSPGTVTSTAADGSLTIRFRSDAATTGAGWTANITCFNPCTVPTLYSVTGGGTRCSSGAALAVGLSGSQVNVSYQLKRNGTNTGTPVAGTNAAISFPAQSSNGTYTVDAVGTGGAFCTTATAMNGSAVITVVSPATQPSINGSAAPCAASSQVYSIVSPVAGTTYTWSFPGAGWSPTSATGSSVTVTVGSTGSSTIQVTPSNAACGNGTAATLGVTVGAGPTVNVTPASASACGGVGVSLTASGASSYSWSPAAGLSATTGATVTANPSTNTTYTVTETSSGCNNFKTVLVRAGPIVTAAANASVSSVCPGGAVNLTSSAANGTITALSPTGDGGFETGTTFAANGWTTVNAASNIWQIGNLAPAYAGSRGAHVSSNGSAYNYTLTAARVSHLYKDVVIPTGATSISLGFYWKGQGEVGWDRMLVFTAPTSVTPVANAPASNGTAISGATLVWTQTAQSTSYAQATVALPNGLAGTTVRLIFTWQNDNNTGPSPGAAIDNVSLTYTPPAGTYTYSWTSSPAGFTSSAQNPTANPTVATTYTVVATNTASGCSDAASTSAVTMNAVPQGTLTANGTVCAGELASLTFTSTAGTGPFTVNYGPSGQSATGVVSGTPFASDLATSAGTNTYTLTSVISSNGCTRSSGFTGASASVTGTAAPAAPATPTSTYNCSTGAVTLSTSGAGAGESYKWYTASSGGSPVSTGSASYAVTPTNSTNYYAAKYYTSGGACESTRVGITAFAKGLNTYTASRSTGVAFTDISASGSVPGWRNGTSDDNLSNNLNIGFSFPFDGATYTQFKMSSDGYITLNAATAANGTAVRACGDAENYSNDNTTFSDFAKLGTVQSIAPFYDDLMPNGQTFANSFHYRTDASPNRLTVQWRGMSKYVDTDDCSPCSYGNYNFQVVLYQTGNIEFNYGTMTSSGDEDSKNYTAGINSATISSPLNTAKLFTQQTANTATFGSTAVNNLSTVPATNTRITLTRTAPIAVTEAPECIVYNFPANGATNQCTNSVLSWSPVDGSPTGYDLYFGTNNPPTNIVNGTTQNTTWYAPTLSSNATYYWRVVPRNASGVAVAANMPIWSFTTGAPNVVNSITSSAGTNLCIGASTTLTVNGSLAEGSVYNWTEPVFFLGFEIASCTEGIPYPLFEHIIDPNACEANSRTLTFTSAGTYRFDVFAKGCNGVTSCKRITITVNDNANTAPTSIASSNGTTLCSGTTTTLTANGGTHGSGASYQWYTGSCGGTLIATTSANTTTVTPTATTTYYVRRTGGTTCANTTTCASQVITVQNAIANNTISAAQTICQGAAPSQLTGSTPTGGSGTYTYNWLASTTSATAGFNSLGSNTINYSPGALSQDTWYKRTVTSGSCTTPHESAVIKVTVTPTVGTPTAITISAGAQPTCQLTNGTTATTYATTATNNTGFTWSLSNAAAGSINSAGVMTWANGFSGTVNIQVRANGCNGPSAMTTRTVNITPSVSTPSFTAGATTLCIGGASTYTATVSNGTVSYSVTGGASINSSSGVISNVTGNFTVTATGTGCNGPTTATRSVTVTPNVGTPSFTAGATTLCIGGASTYTATVSNGTVSYSVTGGASINSSSGVISNVTGNFTVTATGTGCNGPTTATRSVTVTPNVGTPSFTAGATTLCIGGASTYTATVSNGTVSYSVTGGASINSSSGVISNVTGNFTVTATGTGCNGPTTATRSVTVTPNVGTPSFTAGATTLCIGGASTYTATVSNGTVSYSVTGGASINSSSGVISNVTGNFTVTATGTGCNGPTTATRSVTVTPNVGTPSFTAGATTLCIGGASTYTATVSNGSVSYSVTGGASIHSSTGVISNVTGNFTVTATGTGCNGPTTATRSVTVNPLVTPSVSIAANPGNTICVGTNIDFTATPVNGGSIPAYQWQVNGSNAGMGATFSSSTLANHDVVSVVLTSNATCASPTTANDQETITAIGSYNITATSGANGTITHAGVTSVACNGNKSYTITPASSCYVVEDVEVDGISIGAVTSYHFTNVNADRTISATFSRLTYSITATAGSNGSISPSGATVVNCGDDQTYTITPAAGYDVQSVLVDGVPVGAVTSYTFSNVTAPHTISVTFVPGGPTIWTAGMLTTDWYTPGNWTNGVPTATRDALVPVVAPNLYPIVVGGTGAFTKNLTIDAGASVTLSFTSVAGIPQSELEVNGTFTNNGVADMGAGYLTIQGPSIAGSVLVKYLKINNASGVTLGAGASVGVKGELTLQSGTLTTTGGSLRLVSDAASTGYVNDWGVNTGSIASGNAITIERYIPAGALSNFHYIGSTGGGTAAMWNDDFTNTATTSVNGTPVTPKPNCDPLSLAAGSAYGNLFSYDESIVTTCYQRGWRVNTPAHTIARGEGLALAVSAGAVLDETTAYNRSNVSLSNLAITATNDVPDSKGYHLVSNPFFAPIDWNAMMALSPGVNLDHTAYIFDPVSGAYKILNQLSATFAGPISTNMGFFVRGLDTTALNSFGITFNANARTAGTNAEFLRQGQPYAYGLKIKAGNGTHSEEALIAFDEEFTDDYDNGFDAKKLLSSHGVASLYTLGKGQSRKAVEALGINTDVRSVPLGLLVPGAGGAYTLSFDGVEDFPNTVIIWLEDLKTGTIQYLRQNNEYTFVANEIDNPDRFVIHFAPELLITRGAESCNGNDASISLIQRGGVEWAYRLKDENNSVVTSNNFTATDVITGLTSGKYTLNLTHPLSGHALAMSVIVSGAQQVSVEILPSATEVMENEPVILQTQTSGAIDYTWDMGDGNIITQQQTLTHRYDSEGTYEITLVVSSGECSAEAKQYITVYKQEASTGVASIGNGNITVYSNGFRLFVIQDLSKEDIQASLKVFNNIGQLIYADEDAILTHRQAHIATIRVPGVHLVYVKTREGEMITKVHLGE